MGSRNVVHYSWEVFTRRERKCPRALGKGMRNAEKSNHPSKRVISLDFPGMLCFYSCYKLFAMFNSGLLHNNVNTESSAHMVIHWSIFLLIWTKYQNFPKTALVKDQVVKSVGLFVLQNLTICFFIFLLWLQNLGRLNH